MTLESTSADIVGLLRTPHNSALSHKGSIHDDATASKLGFRGGTVAGSLHMDQLVPLLLELYGDDWWKHGNISSYFRQATVDREPVRAFATAGEPHARLWMENQAGDLIAECTASCQGTDADTAVERLMKSQATAAPGALRILSKVKPGDEITGLEVSVTRKALDARLEHITESLPAYQGSHAILPPSMNVALFRGSAQEALYKTGRPGRRALWRHRAAGNRRSAAGRYDLPRACAGACAQREPEDRERLVPRLGGGPEDRRGRVVHAHVPALHEGLVGSATPPKS